jgi:NAD(P)-dependent dehydrogenase (short-subunit alcohol dehydrogenase family)
MGILAGKVALVTGAGQGIGRGIARRFAQESAAVLIVEISEAHGAKVQAEIEAFGGRCKFLRADVSNKDEIQGAVAAAARTFGRLDVLVNNAVKLPVPVLLADKTDAMLEQQLAINVWGAWWAMQAAMPIMRDNGGGSIINFTSMDFETGAWLHADYNVTKGALVALTRSAAIDWARFNIRANALAPIAASTAFEQMCQERPGLREHANASVPLGRMGDPEDDIAPAAVFLASELSRYVTGVTLPVDGGMNLPRMNQTPHHLLSAEPVTGG